MITEELRASILSAPIAAMDRRALSQAWYSALHVAGGIRAANWAPQRSKVTETVSPLRPEWRASEAGLPVHAGGGRRFTLAQSRPASGSAVFERRSRESSLARNIARVFSDARVPVKRSTFLIERSGARVHIVLQSNGPRMRLVAICPPAHKGHVARALAEACAALASRGIALDVQNGPATSCS